MEYTLKHAIRFILVLVFTIVSFYSFGIIHIHGCNYFRCDFIFFLIDVFRGVLISSCLLFFYLHHKNFKKLFSYSLLAVVLVFFITEIYIAYQMDELVLLGSIYWYIDIAKGVIGLALGFVLVLNVFNIVNAKHENYVFVIMSAALLSILLLILSVISLSMDYFFYKQVLLFLLVVLLSSMINRFFGCKR